MEVAIVIMIIMMMIMKMYWSGVQYFALSALASSESNSHVGKIRDAKLSSIFHN